MAKERNYRLSLRFGAVAPSIGEQIEAHGLPLPSGLRALESDADAINRLRFHNVLTDGEVRRARERLMKRVTAAIEVELRAEGMAEARRG